MSIDLGENDLLKQAYAKEKKEEMRRKNKISVHLPSGFNVNLSEDVHDDLYLYFTDSQYLCFNEKINAGSYFPEIAQFISVLVFILRGGNNWLDIVVCSVANGAFFSILWFWLHFYKIPGLSTICCLIGNFLFGHFLHFIPIALISFFVLHDWKVFLFYVIGSIVASIIRSILFNFFSNTKYNNKVVRYISSFLRQY